MTTTAYIKADFTLVMLASDSWTGEIWHFVSVVAILLVWCCTLRYWCLRTISVTHFLKKVMLSCTVLQYKSRQINQCWEKSNHQKNDWLNSLEITHSHIQQIWKTDNLHFRISSKQFVYNSVLKFMAPLLFESNSHCFFSDFHFHVLTTGKLMITFLLISSHVSNY